MGKERGGKAGREEAHQAQGSRTGAEHVITPGGLATVPQSSALHKRPEPMGAINPSLRPPRSMHGTSHIMHSTHITHSTHSIHSTHRHPG
jgi:hypothetical protein